MLDASPPSTNGRKRRYRSAVSFYDKWALPWRCRPRRASHCRRENRYPCRGAALPVRAAASREQRRRTFGPCTRVLFGKRCASTAHQARLDRITDVRVGLRPFRPRGPTDRGATPGTKTVVHNYGHGGAGMVVVLGIRPAALRTRPKRRRALGRGDRLRRDGPDFGGVGAASRPARLHLHKELPSEVYSISASRAVDAGLAALRRCTRTAHRRALEGDGQYLVFRYPDAAGVAG